MNTFDFYTFQVSSSKKTVLKNVGIDADSIHSFKDGYRRYGSKVFPVWYYKANVDFMNAQDATPEKVSKRCAELSEKYGMSVHVSYVCRD